MGPHFDADFNASLMLVQIIVRARAYNDRYSEGETCRIGCVIWDAIWNVGHDVQDLCAIWWIQRAIWNVGSGV